MVFRKAVGTKFGESPTVGICITVGTGDSILHKEQTFSEQWSLGPELVKEMVAGDLAIARREVANGKNPV